ncbi:Fc.00g043020.m01.CDS01 [Cosmosporella sp. VM-42]
MEDELEGVGSHPGTFLRSGVPHGSSPKAKPFVIGIYGIPGSGKTYLLNELKEMLGIEHYQFYEGSEKIHSLVVGGLTRFQTLPEGEKQEVREQAIESIRKEVASTGRIGIVTGHLLFWTEGGKESFVHTQADLANFTHIIYLDTHRRLIRDHRRDDTKKNRQDLPEEFLEQWKKTEKAHLRRLCRENEILFVSVRWNDPIRISKILDAFQQQNEEHNFSRARGRMDKLITPGKVKTVIFLDGDKALCQEDTSILFWHTAIKMGLYESGDGKYPLRTIFDGPLGYSHAAFCQVAMLYEEVRDFQVLCDEVASELYINHSLRYIMEQADARDNVVVVVVTSGPRRVLEEVLNKVNLQNVEVIGSGLIAEKSRVVVTAELKGELVKYVRERYRVPVWVFGDSFLDLQMFKEANEAIVVVGEEKTRSRIMDAALLHAIHDEELPLRQGPLGFNELRQLEDEKTTECPSVDLRDRDFIASIVGSQGEASPRQMIDFTGKPAAQLLMTPTRDGRISGPALREAHRKIGWYLATEVLTEIIGLEEYEIPHVQGRNTQGHRLLDEDKTCVVALMRGGEPMAMGVNDAFPLAFFIHAKEPREIKRQHLEGQETVLLVDSVVNTGSSVVDFINHIRDLQAHVRIVVVAGVVHRRATTRGRFADLLDYDANLGLVALRMSENQFTGQGTTDTGNRLFNTTHLD